MSDASGRKSSARSGAGKTLRGHDARYLEKTVGCRFCKPAGIDECMKYFEQRGSLKAGNAIGNLLFVFLVFIAFDMMWVMYALTYISRFQNTMKNIMKNALLMAVADFGRTLLLFLILAASIFAIWMMPFLAVLIPGFVTCLLNLIFEKIFRKYMSEEDIKEEDERNREYLN